ncbi:MAG: lipopolysaccharide biosynthesis protein [candidate division Zixibacteria bacterium]
MNIKASVISGLKWSSGAKLGTQIINWAITIYVMRLLNPDDYGLLAMAMVFVALCLMLNEMGLGVALVQVKELSDKLLKQTFGLVIGLNCLLLVLLILISGLIAGIFDEPRLTKIILVLSLQFPIMALFVIPNSILQRNMNFRAISIVTVFAELISGFSTLFMAWQNMGVWALVIGSIVRALVMSIGINIAQPFFKMPSFNFSGFAEAAKFGGYVSLQRILWYIYTQSDVFIIGRALGSNILGYYSVAMHIATMPLQKVSLMMSQVGLPAYSRIQDNKELVARYVIKTSRAICFVGVPVFFGISCVAPEMIEVVLKEKWLPSVIPLQLISLIVPLRALNVSLTPAINGIGRPDINAKTLAIACIVLPAAFIIGIKWGLVGVSLAWLIAYSIWFLYMLSQVLPAVGLNILRYLNVLWVPFIWGGIMYGAVYLTRIFTQAIQLAQLPTLVVLIIIGGAVYSTGMFIFSKNTTKEVISVFRKS